MSDSSMKIRKLTVKNFQSIKEITVTFDENGIFRFTGLNNVGKSAILKAMTIVMRNISNNQYKEFLRDETNSFEITVWDFSDNWVRLSRGAVDFYEWSIDGKSGRMDRTQGKVPLEVQGYFNLYEENEKTKACLNVRLPREVLLFVDTTPGDNAMMFQKALGTEEYMLAVKKVDSRAREINKEVGLIEGYLEQEQELLDETNTKLSQDKQELENIERFENKLRTEYEEYNQIEDIVQLTNEYMEKRKEIVEKKEVIKEIDITPIKNDLDNLAVVTSMIELYEEEQELENAIAEKRKSLGNVTEVDFKKEFSILTTIDELVDVARERKVMADGVESKREKVEQAKKELDAFKEKIDICPFCGEDFVEGHAHK